MATYAIGDLQACHREFKQLLKLLEFKPDKDRLWLTGDLIGRGPKPLKTLRSVRKLGDAVTVVLGNHDLHLLARAAGVKRPGRPDPTLKEVLEAPDRDELLEWLRHRPLLHIDRHLGYGMIHAGLPPQWTVKQAEHCAAEVETALRSKKYRDFLKSMYGDNPDRWKPKLSKKARLRFITNCLTRLRYCYADGRLALNEKGRPQLGRDHHLLPWFAVPERHSHGLDWIFGHWSTLGRVEWRKYSVFGLDSGCVWGGALTALCLETGEITQLPCKRHKKPG